MLSETIVCQTRSNIEFSLFKIYNIPTTVSIIVLTLQRLESFVKKVIRAENNYENGHEDNIEGLLLKYRLLTSVKPLAHNTEPDLIELSDYDYVEDKLQNSKKKKAKSTSSRHRKHSMKRQKQLKHSAAAAAIPKHLANY